MDASHFDANTVYAAVNRIRLDDMKPHIYRTKDGGKTWKEITKGLPNDPINAVREDPKRQGLLFAGSERAVYVSFDDGENWQTLRLNMPATSIRDLVIKDDDIVVGTHGRSFWILDDITPLRQTTTPVSTAEATLFAPQNAYRVRWSMYTDTPLPQEEPAGDNPPEGAIINYMLKEKAKGEVVLEIFNSVGQSVRRFSSNDKPYKIPDVNIPLYWIRPQQILSSEAGAHRFTWDMHYKPLDVSPQYPISAIYKNTAPDPTSPWVLPDNYTVKLTVNGKTYSQPLTVRLDPRVKTTAPDLTKQHDLSVQCYEGRQQTMAILEEITTVKKQLKDALTNAKTPVSDKLKTLETKILALENTPQGNSEPNFSRLESAFSSLFNILHDTDMPPTSQTISAVNENMGKMKTLMAQWQEVKAGLKTALGK